MKRLAKVGFSQSYSYFTWRNGKQEITEYLTELTQEECREYMRPNFFANTPDINPVFLQTVRPPRLPHPAGARRDPRRQLRPLQRLRDLRGRAAARQGGVPQLREVRDPRLGLRPAGQHQGRHPPGEPAAAQPPGAPGLPQPRLLQRLQRQRARLRQAHRGPERLPALPRQPRPAQHPVASRSRCRSGSSGCPTTARSRSATCCAATSFTWHGKIQTLELEPAHPALRHLAAHRPRSAG